MSKIRTDVGPWSIVPEWVSDAERSGLSHAAVRLYAVLMLYADARTGEGATPSRATLARRMGLKTTDRVDAAKEELVAAGVLEVEARFSGGKQTSNGYRLALVEPEGGVEKTRPLRGRENSADPVEKTRYEPEPGEPEVSANAETRPALGARIDPLWEALVEAMQTAPPVTASGRGAWNKAVKELRDVGATPELVLAAARHYRKEWPDISITPTALAKHWHEFALTAEARKPKPPCEECGVGGGLHLAECSHATKEVAA